MTLLPYILSMIVVSPFCGSFQYSQCEDVDLHSFYFRNLTLT